MNIDEFLKGTDPNNPDTDDDGVLDGYDYHPLDPGRSEPGMGNGSSSYELSLGHFVGLFVIVIIFIIMIATACIIKRKSKKPSDSDYEETHETKTIEVTPVEDFRGNGN